MRAAWQPGLGGAKHPQKPDLFSHLRRGADLAWFFAMTTPTEKVCVGLFAAIFLVAAGSNAASTLSDRGASVTEPHAAIPACLHVRAESRRGVTGFDHWVFIDSDCDLAAACDVSTDVNPETMTVTIQPRSTSSVLTASEASASKFTPYVTCQLGPPN